MNCLLCRLNPVSADDRAGLCVSCVWAVKRREFFPDVDSAGNVRLYQARAEPGNPLGYEGGGSLPSWAYEPSELYEDGGEPEELAGVTGELMTLACGPLVANRKLARELIDNLRALGLAVGMNAGSGYPEISDARQVPYAMLIEWVRLAGWVADVLTREEARKLKADAAERERFGAAWQDEGYNGIPQGDGREFPRERNYGIPDDGFRGVPHAEQQGEPQGVSRPNPSETASLDLRGTEDAKG